MSRPSEPTICAAVRCCRIAVEGFDLCDPHMEAEEEGQPVRRVRAKPSRKAEDAGMRRPKAPLRPKPKPKPRPAPPHTIPRGPSISSLPREERRAAIKAVIQELQRRR